MNHKVVSNFFRAKIKFKAILKLDKRKYFYIFKIS